MGLLIQFADDHITNEGNNNFAAKGQYQPDKKQEKTGNYEKTGCCIVDETSHPVAQSKAGKE
jgi:hypothetical protein